MCVCVCVLSQKRRAIMQRERFSYVDFKLALKAFLDECCSTCFKVIGIAERCPWPNVSHAYLAKGSFLNIFLLTAHITIVTKNFFWEMLNFSHYREKNIQKYSGRQWDFLVSQGKLTSSFSSLPMCQQKKKKDRLSKAVEDNSGQKITIHFWEMRSPCWKQ